MSQRPYFSKKLVLTFTDKNHINTISSVDGITWSNVNPIAVSSDAATNSPVVYNGKLFVLYSEEDDHTINYVTSDDGLLWSKEKSWVHCKCSQSAESGARGL
nr:hypothetical protein GCM10020185_11440 [Pseudomonas brassicacearum subsp. brassicacearum]